MSLRTKVKVLIVDDSALVRRVLASALAGDPELEVVGVAGDAYEARDKILTLNPDVLTLDIEMPRMDGLTFLRIIQQHHPIPVIIVSSLTQAGSQAALDALELGAVDILAKPADSGTLKGLGRDLAWRVKAAAMSRRGKANAPLPGARPSAAHTGVVFHPRQLLLIGASTGGIEALNFLLSRLPADLPPICITQHVPANISRAVAARLAGACQFEVREAADGDELRPGRAVLAPGDHHMTLLWGKDRHLVRLSRGPKVHFCRPSVDVMFLSAVQPSAGRCVAVLLTGMGNDGAQGMLSLRQAGARTLAQDEQSSVVYGMPRAALELGAVERVVSLAEMPEAIVSAAEEAARQPSAPSVCADPDPAFADANTAPKTRLVSTGTGESA